MRLPGLGVLLVVLALVSEAHAAPVRLLVSIGNNTGDPTDVPLRYADADARRFHELMLELGQVQSTRAYLLNGATVEQVRAAFTEARRVAAPLRVLLLDTCESGIVARRKGGRLVSGYELNLERLPLRGEVLISSSGPAESSEEWESLAGSLFTHHLLTGLRGDADVNGDGQVTVAEAYSYSYRRTVSAAARGSQHPVADIDLSGAGEVVLTEPLRHRSAVLFPPASEGLFTVASQPEPDVLLEVDKSAGRALRLAVPPGRYVVRKRWEGCARFWSTWACPRQVRGWPRREGPAPRARGVEAQAAPDKTLRLLPHGDHNSILPANREEYLGAIRTFLAGP